MLAQVIPAFGAERALVGDVFDILTSAILTSPHPHPLEQQNAHRVSLSLL
jgi:hypothetical protein